MNKEWNISKLTVVRQCHRKLYFNYEVAHHAFTHPFRRKAFELSKVQTLKMWTGSVIDYAVAKMIIPIYWEKLVPDYKSIADEAVALAKRQFRFSALRLYHDNTVARSESAADFLILDVHEFNLSYTKEQIEEVYETIRNIIIAFPDYDSPVPSKRMADYLRTSKFLRADVKNFNYLCDGIIIKPQIDLIRYFGKRQDVIDWKVARNSQIDYSRQLILAGIVTSHNSRNTFKEKGWTPIPYLEDTHLYEINLMNGCIKQHPFTKESTALALDYVYSYCDDQELLSQNKQWNELNIEDYVRTDKADTCAGCKFKPLCQHMIINNYEYDEEKYNELVQNRELAGAVHSV